MDFSQVKAWTIPEGQVKKAWIGGQLVWQAPNPLPYDAEVEYIRTDGYEYILTGVTPDSTIRVTGSFRWNTIVAQARLFSANDNGGREYSLYRGGSNISMRGGNTTATAQFFAGSDGTTYTFSFTPVSGTINGTTHSIGGEHPAHNYEFALFGRNNGGTVYYTDYKMLCDFYWLKIEKGGVLVRDFIPVRVGNIGYLYDRVTGQLFGNAGTGAFVVGPDAGAASAALLSSPASPEALEGE